MKKNRWESKFLGFGALEISQKKHQQIIAELAEILYLHFTQHSNSDFLDNVERTSGFDAVRKSCGLHRGDGMKVEPFTLVREYPVQWVRVKVDLGEIKDLRRKGWTFAGIAKHFGRSKSAIVERLQRADFRAERDEDSSSNVGQSSIRDLFMRGFSDSREVASRRIAARFRMENGP